MTFSELKRRVLTALSVKTRTILIHAISERMSKDPLKYLDPNEATDSDRLKLFKFSLLHVLKDDPTPVALHLMEVMMDYIINSRISVPAPKILKSDDNDNKQVNSQKLKKVSHTKVAPKVKFQIPVKEIATVVIHETPNYAIEVNDGSLRSGDPINEDRSGFTPSQTSQDGSLGCKQKCNKQKRKRVQSIKGSVSPATPLNAKAVRLSSEDAYVDTPNMSSQEVTDGHWTFVANLVNSGLYKDWLLLQPMCFGISCHVDQVRKCDQCVRAILTTPITDCAAVSCKEGKHSSSLFPHSPLTDFISQHQHDLEDDKEVHSQCIKIANNEILPTLLYVMMHDRNVRKVRPPSNVVSALRRTIDTLME